MITGHKGAMAHDKAKMAQQAGRQINRSLGRIEVLALFPLLALTASWFGFDNLALVTAVVLSGLLALAAFLGRPFDLVTLKDAPKSTGREGLVAQLDRVVAVEDRDTACFLIQIDDWPMMQDRLGHIACEEITTRLEDRLQSAMRGGDLMCRISDSRYGVVLGPLKAAQLGLRDTIAGRIAAAVRDPIALNGTTVRLSASIGHTSLVRQGADPAGNTFKAAEAALAEASLHGPGAVRTYAPGMGRTRRLQSDLSAEVETALHQGDITAWFQPHICANTGVLTGIETLARWQHPQHGLLSAKEFLGAAEASGHMPLLGQTLMHKALKALAEWDKAQAHVPSVSLNFTATELSDPKLVGLLALEVARHKLPADRIVIEVSEKVAARVDDDAIVATLKAMTDAGHPVDLEGFGLGQTSIPTLQRLAVKRLKIDQSFVVGVDADPTQARAFSAIVSLSNAMGLQTIATGVETPQEAEKLAELGCHHLQGFGIARPMRAGKVADWARARTASGKTIRLDDRRA